MELSQIKEMFEQGSEFKISLQDIINNPWYLLATACIITYAHGLHIMREEEKKNPTKEGDRGDKGLATLICFIYGFAPVWVPIYWGFKLCQKAVVPMLLKTGQWIVKMET